MAPSPRSPLCTRCKGRPFLRISGSGWHRGLTAEGLALDDLELDDLELNDLELPELADLALPELRE